MTRPLLYTRDAESRLTQGPARVAARGLHARLDGLIQSWLLEGNAFDLVRTGEQTLGAYLAGLGLADV